MFQIGNKLFGSTSVGNSNLEKQLLQVFKSGGKVEKIYTTDPNDDYVSLVIETKNGSKITFQLDDALIQYEIVLKSKN